MDRALLQMFVFLSWGYPAAPDGKNSGRACFYCMCVQGSRYRHKGITLKCMKKRMGECQAFSDEVQPSYW